MQRLKFMIKHFFSEPMWFKMLILATLLISVIFSSSYFSYNASYQVLAKLAAAIFFGAYGIKLRNNRKVSVMFFSLAAICIYIGMKIL
jgi:carbon starvation protein CstA